MIVNNTFRATAARLFEEHAREVAAIEATARPRNTEGKAMNRDVVMSRALLRLAHASVKGTFPLINLRKDSWVWCGGNDYWEFHGPEDSKRGLFVWHGKASNAYEARYKGWMAWLSHMGVA